MPYQYGFADPATLTAAAPASAPSADPLDSFVASQGGLPSGNAHAPTAAAARSAPADPLDAFIASQGGLPKAPAPARASVSSDSLAQDLAAGGASPYGLDDLKQIGSGAWHGVSSMFNNAANLVEKGVAAGANAIPGVKGSAVGDWLTNTANNDVAAQSAADQQFKQTASPGAQATAIVAPMLVPMAGASRAAGAVRDGITALPSMGGTIGRLLGAGTGSAVTGAALSAGSSVDPDQDYWPQVGRNALVGGAAGVAVPAMLSGFAGAGRAAYNAAQPLLNPRGFVGQGLANAVGDDAATVAAQIRSAPQYVPGSLPTLAQAAPNPTLVATEKAAGNSVPGFKVAQAERENANNQARWDALGQIAGTPLDLANAEAARTSATAPLYNTAKQQTLTVDNPMSDLLQRPAMQTAIKRAQALADNTKAGPILQTAYLPNLMGGAPNSVQTLTGSGAQTVKEALDAMLLPENTQKLSGKEIGALQDMRNAYMAWLESKSGDFQTARQTYAAMSPPINTMQAGQQIADSLGGMNRPLNSSGTPLITAPGYATALGRALRAQEFGIEPAAQQTLDNIGQDLQRSTISNSLRAPGSDTAYNLTANGWLAKKLYGADFQGGAVGKALGAITSAAGAAGGAALFGPAGAGVGSAVGSGVGAMLNGARVGARLNKHLGQMLLNPQELLPYLDAQAAGPVAAGQPTFAQLLGRRLQYLPAFAAPQMLGSQSHN